MKSLLLPFLLSASLTAAAGANVSIADTGAVPDGKTLNTQSIQSAIDRIAASGGGTLTVPSGTFLTGAIFLKPKVNLTLKSGAVLLGSTNIQDYPSMPTRVEGHTQVWRPALVNATACDGLTISGSGTIQGGGQAYWDAFYNARKVNRATKNLDVDRPRNLFIRDSKNVTISGISLHDPGFWNLHLYNDQHVTVDHVDIRAGARSPSSDGIDIDSSQYVTVSHSYISDGDDCIALKGSKGPTADQDAASPPTEHIHVFDCTYGRGGGMITLGSEATTVRDVLVENCKFDGTGSNRILTVKLRPDTPQHYQDIHIRNIVMAGPTAVIRVAPWTQYFDLAGHQPPSQLAESISISGVTGTGSSFGDISGPDAATVRNVTLENIDIQLSKPNPPVFKNVQNLTITNIKVNGQPLPPPGASTPASGTAAPALSGS